MVQCLERSHSMLSPVPPTLRPGKVPCPLPSFLPSAPSSYSWYYTSAAGMPLPTSFLTPEISYATRSILYIFKKTENIRINIYIRSPRRASINVGSLFDYKFLMQRVRLICLFLPGT